MKETNFTFPPSSLGMIPILTLPAPLSPLTTMDWFLVSRSLLISQNAFCPTANIWGGSSLIDMDKSKNKWKISFHDAWCICHEGKWKKRSWKKKERWSYSTWVLTLVDYPVFVYKLSNSNLPTLNHPKMLNFTIFIFPPHFSSFNNFKMIKIPQNFLDQIKSLVGLQPVPCSKEKICSNQEI